MVRNGYAIAYRRYSKKYISDEDFAKQNKLGLWQGNSQIQKNGESLINF